MQMEKNTISTSQGQNVSRPSLPVCWRRLFA